MYLLTRSERFKKAYKKLIKRDRDVEQRLFKALELLKNNPYHPSLKTHKVTTKIGYIAKSSWVYGDLRIIWQFSENEIQVIDLLDLGNHGEVY